MKSSNTICTGNTLRTNSRRSFRTIRAEDQAEDFAQTLAHECAQNEPDAVDKVNDILTGIGQNMDDILNRARARKAKELAKTTCGANRAPSS